MRILKLLGNWLTSVPLFETDRARIEKYLSQSVSLADLERRQRELRSKGYLA